MSSFLSNDNNQILSRKSKHFSQNSIDPTQAWPVTKFRAIFFISIKRSCTPDRMNWRTEKFLTKEDKILRGEKNLCDRATKIPLWFYWNTWFSYKGIKYYLYRRLCSLVDKRNKYYTQWFEGHIYFSLILLFFVYSYYLLFVI